MFFWVVASAWIPLLIGLGVWRHAIRKVKLTYDPQYWSMVFPLAMYAICTGGIVDIFKLTALGVISQGFLVIAGAAWLVVFSGLIRNLIGDLRQTIGSKAGSTENPVVQGLGGSR